MGRVTNTKHVWEELPKVNEKREVMLRDQKTIPLRCFSPNWSTDSTKSQWKAQKTLYMLTNSLNLYSNKMTWNSQNNAKKNKVEVAVILDLRLFIKLQLSWECCINRNTNKQMKWNKPVNKETHIHIDS